MGHLLCAQTKTGPRCTNIKLEVAKPRQEDCIESARIECAIQMYDCRKEILQYLPKRQPGGYSVRGTQSGGVFIPGGGPLDDLQCFDSRCLDKLMECYCTGLSGLTCVVCSSDPGGVGFGGGDEDDGGTDIFDNTDTLSVTTSSAEEYIPIVYGVAQLAGNIIWTSDVRTVTKVENISGIRTTTAESFIDIAVGCCEGDSGELLRVWFSDQLVYDRTATTTSAIHPDLKKAGVTFEFYKGSETQVPSAFMRGPAGRMPAHRGLAYVLIRNYPLTWAAGSTPSFRMEISTAVSNPESTWDVTALPAVRVSTEPISGRVLTQDASGGVKVSIESYETVVTTSGATNAKFASDGGLIYYDTNDDKLVYTLAHNYKHKLPIDAPGGLTDFDAKSFSHYEFLPDSGDQIIASFGAVDSTVYRWETSYYSAQSALKKTEVTPGADFKYVFVTDALRRGYGVVLGNLNGDLIVKTFCLYDDVKKLYYSAEQAFTTTVVPLGLTLQRALYISGTEDVLLWATAGLTTYMIRTSALDPLSIKWRQEVNGYPDAERLSSSGSERFSYISGGAVYAVELATGAIYKSYDFAQNNAPGNGVTSQTFHEETGSLAFSNDTGFLSYVYTDRAIIGGFPLSYIVEDLMKKAGLTEVEHDASALDSVYLTGYLVQSQPDAGKVFEELTEFFHFDIFESSSKIKGRPRGAQVPVVLNEDYVTRVTTTRSSDNPDQVTAVTVGYFDVDSEGIQTTQTFDIHGMREDSVDVGNKFEYALNLYATADEVVRSAEVSLLARSQRAETCTTYLGPRYLALESSDVLAFPVSSDIEGTWRLSGTTLDTTWNTQLEGNKDSSDIYEEIELQGMNWNLSRDVIRSRRVVTFPLAIDLPVPHLTEQRDTVMVGQATPDGLFEPKSIRTRANSTSTTVVGPEPSKPVLVGQARTALLATTAEFSTDYHSVLEVQFARDIANDEFTNATSDELYRSFTKNMLFVGRELVQFMNAEINGDTVTFTGIQRGKFNSQMHNGTHVVNEPVTVFDPDSISFVEWNKGVSAPRILVELYDLRDTLVSRLTRSWMPNRSLLIWDDDTILARKRNIGQGIMELEFAYSVRNPSARELVADPDDHPSHIDKELNGCQLVQSPSVEGLPTIFILKAPYDKATFLANLPLGNFINAVNRPNSYPPSTNPYIHIMQHPNGPARIEVPGRPYGAYIDYRSLEASGININTDDVHIAKVNYYRPWEMEVFQEIMPERIEIVKGYLVKGNASYGDFDVIEPV